ncbi:MAG TPA: hypothetical protein VNY33_00730 [Gaiellaceae bacterium]|jgi:hypothetical protein|nr:hypothetical protein [Gaiellaceae bacterium]
MNRFRTSILAAAVLALVAATSASALASATKVVAFTGTYAGQASALVSGNVATISATGAGKGTLIGTGKIIGHGTGDSSQQPCIPFGGTGTISGAGGTISYKVVPGSSGCGDEGGHTFTVTAHLTVVKATGKLLKAKGTLKLAGVYNHDDGSFSVKVSGNLTKPS